MARWIYHSRGDNFNEWHRTIDGLAAVDIDLVPMCPDCFEPLALIEHAFDKNQKYKNCTATKKLAEKAGIPSLLIFYNIPVTRLRVTILTPKYKAERIIKPYTLVKYLKKLQSTHVCNKIIN